MCDADEATRNAFVEAIARGQVATGVSSKAMAWAALGWSPDVGHAMPYDSGDWGRCVRTYEAAPPHLQDRMRPIMDLYYRRLTDHTERVGGADWRLRDVAWPLAS
jgi:hypothetical protein